MAKSSGHGDGDDANSSWQALTPAMSEECMQPALVYGTEFLAQELHSGQGIDQSF